MEKIKVHSIVDVITNSSTVIYTYQDGSINPAKELINEMLKLSGIEDKTADDIFYFGVFCDNDRYFDNIPEDIEGFPEITAKWDTDEYKEQQELQNKWLSDLQLSIMKGEINKPSWMKGVEESDDWNPDSYLTLIPKDEKYSEFGNKICSLLNSVSADGGRDG